MGTRGGGTFSELILCHLDLVYRVALKLTGDEHEAQDLTQEVYLRAHRSADKFELREYGAKPWLLKILHNAYFSRRGQMRRGPAMASDLSLDDFEAELEAERHPPVVDGGMNWEGFDEELKQAIESLSPEYRSVILLWALGDLSYKEIGRVLGCAIGTVMSRLHRARQQLNQALGGYAEERGVKASPKSEGRSETTS